MLSHFSCTGDKPKVLGLLESKPLLTALETLLLKVATIDIAATLSRKRGEDYHQSGSAKTRPSWFTREKTAGKQTTWSFIREPTNTELNRAHPTLPLSVGLPVLAGLCDPPNGLGQQGQIHESFGPDRKSLKGLEPKK